MVFDLVFIKRGSEEISTKTDKEYAKEVNTENQAIINHNRKVGKKLNDPEVLEEFQDSVDITETIEKLLEKESGIKTDKGMPLPPRDFRELEGLKKNYSSFFDDDSGNSTTEGLEQILELEKENLASLSFKTPVSVDLKKALEEVSEENSHKKTKTDSISKPPEKSLEKVKWDELGKSPDKPVDKSKDKSPDKPAEKSNDKPSDKPVDSSNDKPSDKLVDNSKDKSSDKPVDKSNDGRSDKPNNGPSDKPTDGPSDVPNIGPSDKPTDGGSDKPADGSSNVPSNDKLSDEFLIDASEGLYLPPLEGNSIDSFMDILDNIPFF